MNLTREQRREDADHYALTDSGRQYVDYPSYSDAAWAEADPRLQASIDDAYRAAMARWKLSIEHTRRSQAQRWRHLVKGIRK